MNADILKAHTPAELFLAEAFNASKASLPGTSGVAKWRNESFGAFYEAGLPHRRVESWHYTDLRALMRACLPLSAAPTAYGQLREELAAVRAPEQRIVLADGFFVPELSGGLPHGLKVRSLSSVLAEGPPDLIALLAAQDQGSGDSMVSLNAALMQDGVVIEAAPGAVIAEPVHLIHLTASSAPAAHYTRSALIAGAGASIRLAEWRRPLAGAAGQTNACFVISLGDGAALKKGECGIRQVQSFSTEDLYITIAGEVPDFDPKERLKSKPLMLADNVINLSAFAGMSVPLFWLAILLIMLFSVYLRILPASGTATV
ncbi:MAG: hypothetical protein L0Y57_01465, partial [Beijerinckiaceae bacterium]|nr:hypothetical protein [Beijerinckiaceae bacterium]